MTTEPPETHGRSDSPAERRRERGAVTQAEMERVRAEAASAEQRASFLAALAILGLSDSVRMVLSITRMLRTRASDETVSLGIAVVLAVIAAVAFTACAFAGGATLLDRAHLRLVRHAMFGRGGGRDGEDFGERVFHEAARRGQGETAKVLEAKLVLGLRCTGWFLLGGAMWIAAKAFAA